jgi:hypothetical protein
MVMPQQPHQQALRGSLRAMSELERVLRYYCRDRRFATMIAVSVLDGLSDAD